MVTLRLRRGTIIFSDLDVLLVSYSLSPDMDVVLGQLGRSEGGSCLDPGELLDSYWAFSNSVSNSFR